ncbi:hypothetical protein PAPYR_9782 [Paratrimastix pyriformis]|uniref:C3H1-type domain-containing protein n=1 Tax=Paratrimastix pyriformis TaxID=342808 RepID=A0ABQ8UD84_9EUKA|nr:hypothetical protein PAPYR_9782 [Paratrimastix pyriformis]
MLPSFGFARIRCTDYHEQGYCLRGPFCHFMHEPDAVPITSIVDISRLESDGPMDWPQLLVDAVKLMENPRPWAANSNPAGLSLDLLQAAAPPPALNPPPGPRGPPVQAQPPPGAGMAPVVVIDDDAPSPPGGGGRPGRLGPPQAPSPVPVATVPVPIPAQPDVPPAPRPPRPHASKDFPPRGVTVANPPSARAAAGPGGSPLGGSEAAGGKPAGGPGGKYAAEEPIALGAEPERIDERLAREAAEIRRAVDEARGKDTAAPGPPPAKAPRPRPAAPPPATAAPASNPQSAAPQAPGAAEAKGRPGRLSRLKKHAPGAGAAPPGRRTRPRKAARDEGEEEEESSDSPSSGSSSDATSASGRDRGGDEDEEGDGGYGGGGGDEEGEVPEGDGGGVSVVIAPLDEDQGLAAPAADAPLGRRLRSQAARSTGAAARVREGLRKQQSERTRQAAIKNRARPHPQQQPHQSQPHQPGLGSDARPPSQPGPGQAPPPPPPPLEPLEPLGLIEVEPLSEDEPAIAPLPATPPAPGGLASAEAEGVDFISSDESASDHELEVVPAVRVPQSPQTQQQQPAPAQPAPAQQPWHAPQAPQALGAAAPLAGPRAGPVGATKAPLPAASAPPAAKVHLAPRPFGTLVPPGGPKAAPPRPQPAAPPKAAHPRAAPGGSPPAKAAAPAAAPHRVAAAAPAKPTAKPTAKPAAKPTAKPTARPVAPLLGAAVPRPTVPFNPSCPVAHRTRSAALERFCDVFSQLYPTNTRRAYEEAAALEREVVGQAQSTNVYTNLAAKELVRIRALAARQHPAL